MLLTLTPVLPNTDSCAPPTDSYTPTPHIHQSTCTCPRPTHTHQDKVNQFSFANLQSSWEPKVYAFRAGTLELWKRKWLWTIQMKRLQSQWLIQERVKEGSESRLHLLIPVFFSYTDTDQNYPLPSGWLGCGGRVICKWDSCYLLSRNWFLSALKETWGTNGPCRRHNSCYQWLLTVVE